MKTLFATLALATLFATAPGASADEAVPGSADKLSVAQIGTDGKLQKPADLANWVFLGASLGMGYNPGSFNAARPGQFQVALMEPSAYQYFVRTGRYAPGSMFLLSFYDSDVQQRSINQNGFTQADLTNFEIHLIDPAANKDGRVFYLFGATTTQGTPLPPGNGCAKCHNSHGAFEGTFAQFYPTIRPLIPKEALERAARDHDIR
jgi:Cytochrome P460